MESLIQTVIKFDTLISTLIAIGIILSMVYVFYSRSGSTYSLYYRLWSLLVGEKNFHDVHLESYMQERKDLDKFNAIFNTDIKKKNDLDDFYKWLVRYDIDIKKISESKGNFDFHNMKMRKPHWMLIIMAAIFSVLMFIFGVAIAAISITDKAILQFHDGEPWVLINHNMAKPMFNKYIITPKDCLKENYNANKIMEKTKFYLSTVETICHSFNSNTDKEIIDKFVASQKKVSWLTFVILYVSFRFFIFSTRGVCARDCRTYIKKQLIIKRRSVND
ncbi:DUF6216 family protein [Erwinia mallotivora]|uniref:Uncharacterized protein n=1 Tax=Erwinia mallotivora TaxID=69222 RepID=A0A014NQA9_9GAMM|nr:DUF6216 family protein [Erwinia mallotivora]EXU76025.1 hypothetical protein BG55_07880 [Erwinia mallotivora]